LKVVFISSPYDAKGLLVTAIRSNDPVIFFEPKRIYRSIKEEVPEEEYEIPFGIAAVETFGHDVTLIGWGAQHHQNMEAAKILKEKHQVGVEVLNMRTLNPLDINAIVTSVQKTGRVVVAHEAPKTQGFGAEIAAQVMERCFLFLEAPVKRCCGLDTPFPNALEKEYLPDSSRVIRAVLEVKNY
jgi:2-oxoisovalerate dehydrogenase E1 component beta subunit